MKKKIELKSALAHELLQYREFRAALGFCQTEGMDSFYRNFDSLLASFGVTEKVLPKSIVDEWCRKRCHESDGNRFKRVCQLRQFCIYLSDRGYEVYIPPRNIAPAGQKYDAHVFTDDELKRFFKAIDHPKFHNAGTVRKDAMLPVFFRILYTSGMRVSELAGIHVGDIDLDNAVITVRNGKNGKDRLVPFHRSLVEPCRKIIPLLDSPQPDDYFFQIREGKCPTKDYIYSRFRATLKQAGISHMGRGHGPRVHDFRHTFCVNLMRKWMREKRNLLASMPYMQAMLGHSGFEGTAYYLKLVAQEFPEIRDRVENKFPDMFEDPVHDEPEFY